VQSGDTTPRGATLDPCNFPTATPKPTPNNHS